MRSYKLSFDPNDDNDSDSDIERALSDKRPVLSEEQKVEQALYEKGLPPTPLKRSGLEKYQLATEDLVLVDENLSEDFWRTTWKQPSLPDAVENSARKVYGLGNAKTFYTNITSSEKLPIGIKIYFQLLKSMTIAFTLMFLCSVPLLMFVYYGHGLQPEDQDFLGLYMYVLGNLGDSTLQGDGTYDYTWPRCSTNETDSQYNQTCLNVESYQFSPTEVSFLITSLECLQILIFLFTLCHIRRIYEVMVKKQDSVRPVNISDYSVCIENIPPDITEKELIKHFSNLYQLSTKDWRGRLPVEDYRPVQHCGNSQYLVYLGGWVGEVTLYRKIGPIFSLYRQKQELMKDLFRLRALMKMTSTLSTHPAGPQEDMCKDYEQQMLRVARKIDQVMFRIKELVIQKMNRKMKPTPTVSSPQIKNDKDEAKKGEEMKDVEKALPVEEKKNNDFSDSDDEFNNPTAKKKTKEQPKVEAKGNKEENKRELITNPISNPPSPSPSSLPPSSPLPPSPQGFISPKLSYYLDNAPVQCAYVTFEYTESKARCLEDYSKYSTFPFNLCAPKAMKIRDKYMPKISPALSPDEILFHHLDQQDRKNKIYWKIYLVVVLIMLTNIIVLVFAGYTRQRFNGHVPTNDMCSYIIPSSYSAVPYTNTSYYEDISLTRPDLDLQEEYDSNCSAIIPQSIYLIYTYNSLQNTHADIPTTNQPVANYSYDECLSGVKEGYCPVWGKGTYCPCAFVFDLKDVDNKYRKVRCQSATCQGAIYGTDDGNSTLNSDLACAGYAGDSEASCYCKDYLQNLIEAQGLTDYIAYTLGLSSFEYQASSDKDYEKCYDLNNIMISAIVLKYISILYTLLSDQLIRYWINSNNKHIPFKTKEDVHVHNYLALSFARYINLGLLALLGYGVTFNHPPLNVERGPYIDSNRDWYLDLGHYFLLTYILYIMGPLLYDLAWFYGYLPIKKYFALNTYRLRGGYKVTMQRDLDALELGPAFPLAINTARITVLLLFTFTYASALPLMTPVAFMTLLITYIFQRNLLFTYFQSINYQGRMLFKYLYNIFPYICLIRVIFACWLLSSDHIVPNTFPQWNGMDFGAQGVSTGALSFKNYNTLVTHLQENQYLPPWLDELETRVKRVNIFPIFVLGVLIAVGLLLEYFYRYIGQFILKSLFKLIKFLYTKCCVRKDSIERLAKYPDFIHPYEIHTVKDPLRPETAPFTGLYHKYLGRKTFKPTRWSKMMEFLKKKVCCYFADCFTDPADRSKIYESLPIGWEVSMMGLDCEVKVKTWPSTEEGQDLLRLKGEHKRTYEVIVDEDGSYTYGLELLRAYQYAYLNLREYDLQYNIAAHYLTEVEKERQHMLFTPTVLEERQNKKDDGYRKNKIVPINKEPEQIVQKIISPRSPITSNPNTARLWKEVVKEVVVDEEKRKEEAKRKRSKSTVNSGSNINSDRNSDSDGDDENRVDLQKESYVDQTNNKQFYFPDASSKKEQEEAKSVEKQKFTVESSDEESSEDSDDDSDEDSDEETDSDEEDSDEESEGEV